MNPIASVRELPICKVDPHIEIKCPIRCSSLTSRLFVLKEV